MFGLRDRHRLKGIIKVVGVTPVEPYEKEDLWSHFGHSIREIFVDKWRV